MTGIKLEVGKRYVDKLGLVRGPMQEFGKSVFIDVPGNGYVWELDGRVRCTPSSPTDPSKFDLVSEHVEPAPEAGVVSVPAGFRLVPIAALAWLFGEGPDEDGLHFGEGAGPKSRGAFWWRPKFAAMLATSPPPPSDPVEQKLVEALKPFADLGVGSGPGYEAETYRITREAIRAARAALALVGEVG